MVLGHLQWQIITKDRHPNTMHLELFKIQVAAQALCERARTLNIRPYEDCAPLRIFSELVPVALQLLMEANTLLEQILDIFNPPAGDDPWIDDLSFEPTAAVRAAPAPRCAAEETAFIARIELRQRELRLRQFTPAQDITAVLIECDSSLRRIQKALGAVDQAIAETAATRPILEVASDLETSLLVRRAYAKFMVGIAADDVPTAETLRARLRLAGTRIAKLVGWSAYPEMRVQDRLLLGRLQHRMLEWLRAPADSELEGIRLWSDFTSCIAMFRQINRRQELVAHDRAVLEQLRAEQRLGTPAARWLDKVRLLEGLDPALDQLLLGGAGGEGDPVRDVIARLCKDLLEGPRPHAPMTTADAASGGLRDAALVRYAG